MTFVQRLITAQFSNGVQVSGLRTSLHIDNPGRPSMAKMTLRIWGMSLSDMNGLSTLGMLAQGLVSRNTITVQAGDAQSGMNQVFMGTIDRAISDFQGQANVPFVVDAHAGAYENAKAIKPTSLNGPSVDVASGASALAGQMGLQFENNGVSNKLGPQYLHGTGVQQMQSLADAAQINWTIENGTLAIWPKNGNRSGQATIVSPSTGMVGYPGPSAYGIKVKMLFNPNLKFGGQIQVQSSVQPANGTWTIYRLDHDLESQEPNGQWFTTAEVAKFSGSGSSSPISTPAS